jgi:hypothetical protein
VRLRRPIRVWERGVGVVGLIAGLVSCGGQEAEDPIEQPPPLSSHAMTYHDRLGMTVLFGGTDTDGVPTDALWGWDGSTWRLLSQGGPGPRLHAGLAYDSGRDRLVVYGGIRNRESSYGDTWEWDGAVWELRLATARSDASGATVSGDGPGIRDHHALAYDPVRRATVLFGGQNENDEYPADTWEWNGETWTRTAVDGPEPRGTHRLAWDGSRIRLVAGWGEEGVLSDVWAWDGAAWSRLDSDSLTARGATRFVYDSARDELVLFGGLVDGDASAETWIEDATGWRRLDVAGPPARNVHAMAYDPVRQMVVLYGGIGADGKLADTWEWDGGGWVRRGEGEGQREGSEEDEE